MGCKVTKNNTASIQYIERIFERRRGSRISGEKLLILKKGGGPLNTRGKIQRARETILPYPGTMPGTVTHYRLEKGYAN